MIKIKYIVLILLVLRVAAPVSLAGYMWMKNRGKDVSSNFDKIVCGDIYVPKVSVTPVTPNCVILYTKYKYLLTARTFYGTRGG